MTDNLSILFPEQTFTTSIGKIVIAPFKFKQTKQALDLIAIYKGILFTGKTVTITDLEGKEKTITVAKTSDEIIDEILAKDSDKNYKVIEDIITLLLLSSPQLQEDSINDLGYQEVIYLLSIIIKSNQDFFTQIGNLFKTSPQEEEKKEAPAVTIGELRSAG
jgi:hypothetical protein